VLQTHDGANGNLADCSRPLLVSGAFVFDDRVQNSLSNISVNGSSGSADNGSSKQDGSVNEVRLRAQGETVISGIEAEFGADFRRGPDRARLDGELEDINLPIGTPISFCLVEGNNTIPLAVGAVRLKNQRMDAEFTIRTDWGEQPPEVTAGSLIEARNGASVGSGDCGKPLLVSGTFVPDN
jgi:hypothetical protein